jgi:hypothetical protein
MRFRVELMGRQANWTNGNRCGCLPSQCAQFLLSGQGIRKGEGNAREGAAPVSRESPSLLRCIGPVQ